MNATKHLPEINNKCRLDWELKNIPESNGKSLSYCCQENNNFDLKSTLKKPLTSLYLLLTIYSFGLLN